jgi:flagellar protein FlaG
MRVCDATLEVEVKALRNAQPPRAPAPAEAPLPTGRQASAAPPVEVPKMESVTRQIDSFLRSINRSLQFRVDEATGRMVVSLYDAETGEVIRQLPGEDALRIAQRIQESLGAMLDEQA